MGRVCFGEFDSPDGRGKQEFFQYLFLETIERVDQAPLKQLYGSPFDMYRQCCKDFGLEYGDIHLWWGLTGAARSVVKRLKADIDAWSKAWNLDAEWCRETALSSLHAWSCSSKKLTELFFSHPGGGGGVPTPVEPPEGLPRYIAYMMSRDYYLETVRSAALHAISENPLLHHGSPVKAKALAESILRKAIPYCREVEAPYLESGWKRCRKNEKKNLKQHMEWTVQFQVSGKTLSEVAEESNVEQTTVSRAVREVLSTLPLTSRPDSKPGRIRGSKNRKRVVSSIRGNLGR